MEGKRGIGIERPAELLEAPTHDYLLKPPVIPDQSSPDRYGIAVLLSVTKPGAVRDMSRACEVIFNSTQPQAKIFAYALGNIVISYQSGIFQELESTGTPIDECG